MNVCPFQVWGFQFLDYLFKKTVLVEACLPPANILLTENSKCGCLWLFVSRCPCDEPATNPRPSPEDIWVRLQPWPWEPDNDWTNDSESVCNTMASVIHRPCYKKEEEVRFWLVTQKVTLGVWTCGMSRNWVVGGRVEVGGGNISGPLNASF